VDEADALVLPAGHAVQPLAPARLYELGSHADGLGMTCQQGKRPPPLRTAPSVREQTRLAPEPVAK
jgi:hypothetical protein